MNVNQVLKKELERISLSKEETDELRESANKIVNKLASLGFRAEIGGSLAKGTMIRKSIQDVDIFVVFSEEKNVDKLEKVLEKLKFNFKVIHGSRDYFQIKEKNVIFELIPVKEFISSDNFSNITDFSLIHVNYVKRQLKKNPKLADEIKLAKAFCYAQNCYGAESYIKGFSGYALELLIINFRSFVNFLKRIKLAMVVDIEKKFKNPKIVFEELNESKLLSPIILIDPTYKFRNAAAGLSEEIFDNFLFEAKKFLKNPSEKAFKLKEINVYKLRENARKKKARFLQIRFHTYKQEGDIAGTKMKKFFEFLIKELERKEQKVLSKDFEYEGHEEALGYLVVKEKKEIEVKGPPKSNKQAVKNFKKVRKKIYFKSNFAYAKEKISLDDIFAFLKRYEDEMSTSFEILG